MHNAPATDPGILLLSELFPPAVGGSAVLFGEIYSRLGSTPVTVVSDGVEMVKYGLSVRSPRSLWRYLRLAWRLRDARRTVGMVHCGRVLPEGLAAWLSRMAGGPRYACWAHGEDVAAALSSRELTLLIRAVFGGADVVFCNSANTRRMVREIGVPDERLEIVYPGVDTRRFRPDVDAHELRQRLAPRGETVLLSVGRLQPRKGQDLVIQALRQLVEQGRSVRYVIVGTDTVGIAPERSRLEALAEQCGVRDFVTFEGEVPGESLPKYFAACDIFAMPNRIEQGDVEGFGIVFLEAAAAGKPTIGGRTGGVPEAVADGLTGLLVSGTDADELAATIAKLLDSASLRRSLGEAGRARAVGEFTWEYGAQRVLTAHRRLAAPSRDVSVIRAAAAHERKAP